jgi:hypothetical protein
LRREGGEASKAKKVPHEKVAPVMRRLDLGVLDQIDLAQADTPRVARVQRSLKCSDHFHQAVTKFFEVSVALGLERHKVDR